MRRVNVLVRHAAVNFNTDGIGNKDAKGAHSGYVFQMYVLIWLRPRPIDALISKTLSSRWNDYWVLRNKEAHHNHEKRAFLIKNLWIWVPAFGRLQHRTCVVGRISQLISDFWECKWFPKWVKNKQNYFIIHSGNLESHHYYAHWKVQVNCLTGVIFHQTKVWKMSVNLLSLCRYRCGRLIELIRECNFHFYSHEYEKPHKICVICCENHLKYCWFWTENYTAFYI